MRWLESTPLFPGNKASNHLFTPLGTKDFIYTHNKDPFVVPLTVTCKRFPFRVALSVITKIEAPVKHRI
jgi:hypothetical protein